MPSKDKPDLSRFDSGAPKSGQKSRKERRDFAAAWMHGYYRDEDDPPTIDFDKMKSDFGKLGAYCATRPTVGIITAADELFEK